MKTIYIDSDFKCHLTNDDTRTAIETDFFDGICDVMVEGYRFVPAGQTWTRRDGVVFEGEMIAPWKPWNELDVAQREYEREQLSQLKTENTNLINNLAQLVEEVYQNDLEVIGL